MKGFVFSFLLVLSTLCAARAQDHPPANMPDLAAWLLKGYAVPRSFLDSVAPSLLPWMQSQLRSKLDCEKKEDLVVVLRRFNYLDAVFDLLKEIVEQPEHFAQSGENPSFCNGGGYDLRFRAVQALSGCRHPGCFSLLVSLQHDPNIAMRRLLAEALWELDPVGGRAVLEALSRDTVPYVRSRPLEYLAEMDRGLRPCADEGMFWSLEWPKDTFVAGEAPVVSIIVHNCSDKRIFMKRSGCDTRPSSFDQVYEVKVEKDGKSKLKTVWISAGCGITGLYPVFPGGIYELKLNMLDWADIGEAGTYQLSIAGKWQIYTHSGVFFELARDCPDCVRTLPFKLESRFVVVPAK